MSAENETKNENGSFRITLINVPENETFRYSLPIIKGFISGHNRECIQEGIITLERLDSNDHPDEITTWPVVHGRFKCLANLNLGKNRFILKYENSRLYLNFTFLSKTTNYHVLPVYIICNGSDGRFQAPDNVDNSPESACRRISLGSRLIQSLIAEKLRDIDPTGRTFRLARDIDINMECLIFHSKLKSDEVYDMKPEEIWENFGREIMSSPYGSDKRKFLAFLSCTKYGSNNTVPETHEEVISRVRGHVALGGGGLAVFGTGCLYTWPETIEEILPKFMDLTKINKLRYMDDSCYRGTYGGCFATTLGAVCHELGHAFDLGHCKKGIMGRGFDNVNLVFMCVDHSKNDNKNLITRNNEQHATVCFTRDLSVTYTVSSPIMKPRSHLYRVRIGSPQRRISMATHLAKKCWSADDPCHHEEKQHPSNNGFSDDLTFWERSCAVLLRYHKWFSNDNIPQILMSAVNIDLNRYLISSKSGIRVVELRGVNGFVLASWEFINTCAPKQFKIPMQNFNIADVKVVVAEDSNGNLLKQELIH